MKPVIFPILLVFISLSARPFAQSMLEEGNQWTFQEIKWTLAQGYVDTFLVTITVEEDTIIDGLFYSKVVHSHHPPCWNIRTTEYLRREGNKIYRRSRSMDQDFLMLDFDETVGYEMLFDGGHNPQDTAYVLIDSVGILQTSAGDYLNVQYVRVINNQATDDDAQFIIGREIGFIEWGIVFPQLGNGLCDFHDPIEWRCAIISGDTTHFFAYDCFELISSTKNPPHGIYAFYPNPFEDYILIPPDMRFAELISITGQRIQLQKTGSSLYTGNLVQGFYVVRMVRTWDNTLFQGVLVKL